MFWVWNQDFHRPTRDIDLLTYTDNDVEHLISLFREVVGQEQDDGLFFDPDTVDGIEIKEDTDYSGVRVTGFASLQNARIPFQIDIGYGDIVVPSARKEVIPAFLDLPQPELKIYPVYGVLSEKFQAMVILGLANSRMKDFYDISSIAHSMPLEGSVLAEALLATFERRKTPISAEPLYLFSHDFKNDENKQKQWKAFLNKNGLEVSLGFADVVTEVQKLIEPVYQAIARNESFDANWEPDNFSWRA